MYKHNLFTFNFKKNIKYLLKMLVFGFIILLYFNSIMPQYEGLYSAALVDKVYYLKSIEGSKIVLLGNSNLTFGIDSKLIEEELGMPVVNMGLSGSLGNPFHEAMAKYNIEEGDIYIICHTSFSDDDTILDPTVAWLAVENHLELWKIIRFKDFYPMLKSFPVYLKRCINLHIAGTGNADDGTAYSRSAFNQYGDVGVLRVENEFTFETTAVDVPPINDTAVKRINQLNNYLEARGASLLIASYPVGNGKVTVDAQQFVEFQENLASQLDCEVISNYVDYMFDYTYFYDTPYHLTTEGAALRTEQLIADIKRWQENGNQDAALEQDAYCDIVSDANLSHITDVDEYIDALKKGINRYCIFISAKNEGSDYIDIDTLTQFKNLGLYDIAECQPNQSYLAVIAGDDIFEDVGSAKLEVQGEIGALALPYHIISAGQNHGNVSSIILKEKEYSQDFQGLNIVVYSSETGRILDEVTFDIYSQDVAAAR